MKHFVISLFLISFVVFSFASPDDAFGCVKVYDPINDFLPWLEFTNSDCSVIFYVPSLAGLIYGVIIGIPTLIFIRKRK